MPCVAGNALPVSYRLGTGDTIKITVENESDLTLTHKVSEQGTIEMPLLGAITVANHTPKELAEEIQTRLRNGFLVHPVVTVAVLEYPSYLVHGEVKKGGGYPFQPGMTVKKAIESAGGFAPFAERNHFTISRRQNAGWELLTSVSLDDPIMPKDILHVSTSVTPQETGESVEFAYRIGPGDKLKVTVDNETSLSAEVTVSAQGGINLPMLGEVTVANLTVKDAEESIRTKLAAGFLVDPVVFVTVAEYRVYYMHGEIKKAGAFPFQPGLTVRKAIALAEGFTEYADRKGILIVHDNDPLFKEHTVNLNDPILPGDVVNVTASFW
ncbi:MAG: polysaccharide biosynthesis/export family protein [Magnetococcales bacterium]|nr:polysaccharide biosynthesis/export family protein [Magnetococcales bacterium]